MRPCSCIPCATPAGLGRRSFFATVASAATLACVAPAMAQPAAAPAHTALSADQALAALMDGNARFLAGQVPPGAPDPARRAMLAAGQAPYAAVLGCADSRAAPELLFHAGLGEIFVVRNAGNMADTAAIGSLEYAVAVLGVKLVMVLGHERCGAASAAVSLARDDAALPGHLRDMLLPMLPAALAALRAGGDLVDGTVKANIRRVAARVVQQSPVIGPAVAAGQVKVVGAYYDLEEERVRLLA